MPNQPVDAKDCPFCGQPPIVVPTETEQDSWVKCGNRQCLLYHHAFLLSRWQDRPAEYDIVTVYEEDVTVAAKGALQECRHGELASACPACKAEAEVRHLQLQLQQVKMDSLTLNNALRPYADRDNWLCVICVKGDAAPEESWVWRGSAGKPWSQAVLGRYATGGE